MISSRSHQTIGLNVILVGLLMLSLQGCFVINLLPSGKLSRYTQQVVLEKDFPAYYAMDEKGHAGTKLGTLQGHAGDTITTLGYFSGDMWETTTYFLIIVDGREVYIDRQDVLTADDQLYRRLSNPFNLTFQEDYKAWDHALNYIRNHTGMPVEIASDVLIKTKSVDDSTSISYLVTRLEQSSSVQYEIICRSFVPGFDATREARRMAFYMVTGRNY